MQTHLKVTAVLFIVLGIVLATVAVFSSVILGAFALAVGASGETGAPLGAALLGLTGFAVTVVLLVLAVPSVLAGWGLLRRKPWARTLGIVLAAIALIEFPAGTIFGVYVLWVLFNRETEALIQPRTQVP